MRFGNRCDWPRSPRPRSNRPQPNDAIFRMNKTATILSFQWLLCATLLSRDVQLNILLYTFRSVACSMSLQCDHIRYRLIAFYKSIFPKKNVACARFSNTHTQWCTEMSSNGNVVRFLPLAVPVSEEETEKCQNELHERHQQEQPSRAKKELHKFNDVIVSSDA